MSIIRTSLKQTSGNQKSVAQVFYQNIFYDLPQVSTIPFVFDVPIFTTNGGSVDYYGQDSKSIFTNLVKPFIRFNFIENTSSFGSNTFIKHDIYKISWDIFQKAESLYEIESESISVKENVITETIEDIGDDGELKIKTIRKTISDFEGVLKGSKTSVASDPMRTPEPLTKDEMREKLRRLIQEGLMTPEYSITKPTTGITGNLYDLQLDQFTKKIGKFKSELFEDRSQYIVDTNFIFNVDITTGLTDLKIIENGSIVNGSYSSSVSMETKTEKQIISDGNFNGFEFIGGNYFTYLEVPDKPVFEYPTAEGQLTTFTPEIFWSNGESADEYSVQVSYNTGDTGFTGTVFTYIVPKSDDFKEESTSRIKTSSSEFDSTKTIRKYQLSLKSNKDAIYRVGNVKFIENIFGVKQSVVTFSDNKFITTQQEPIKTYVYVENDSPYKEFIEGLKTPPSLDEENAFETYILSGIVSGSTITGATIQLIYPNSNFITTPTDLTGYFEFDNLEEGAYTLNTSYRGYAYDSRIINISGDTSVFVELEIKWDNEFDIWAIKENDIIKY